MILLLFSIAVLFLVTFILLYCLYTWRRKIIPSNSNNTNIDSNQETSSFVPVNISTSQESETQRATILENSSSYHRVSFSNILTNQQATASQHTPFNNRKSDQISSAEKIWKYKKSIIPSEEALTSNEALKMPEALQQQEQSPSAAIFDPRIKNPADISQNIAHECKLKTVRLSICSDETFLEHNEYINDEYSKYFGNQNNTYEPLIEVSKTQKCPSVSSSTVYCD